MDKWEAFYFGLCRRSKELSHLLDGSEVKWSAGEKREELVLLVSPSASVSRHPQPLV